MALTGRDSRDAFFSPMGNGSASSAQFLLKKVPSRRTLVTLLALAREHRWARRGRNGTIVFATAEVDRLEQIGDSGGAVRC